MHGSHFYLISHFCSGILEGNAEGTETMLAVPVRCALPSAQTQLKLLNKNWHALLLYIDR